MDEQQNKAEEAKADEGANQPDGALFEQLREENRALLEELERVRTDMQIREDKEKGRTHLQELVGKQGGPLYEKALEKAQMEELSSLPYEKRYELGYLICLGEETHRNRLEGTPKSLPPRFAPSAGNGQVLLSAEKRPTTFEMAKENAKRYLNLKH